MSMTAKKWVPALLFVGFVWLLTVLLAPVATSGWVGPVPARNLESGLDAGGLFYTDVERGGWKRTRTAADPGANNNLESGGNPR